MNLAGLKLHQDAFFKYEYAREALKNGLKLEQELGANPFKFGLIGGTDQHIGLTAIEEDNYFGVWSCTFRERILPALRHTGQIPS
jgi:hypothetical protein